VPAIATGATVDVSELTAYYASLPTGTVEVTISPALTGTGQFYRVNYDSSLGSYTWPTTNLPHLSWVDDYYPTTNGIGFVIFDSTPLSTNWVALTVEGY
jgi:hypothetical protein